MRPNNIWALKTPPNIQNTTLKFLLFSDGSSSFSIVPIAALLTGILLTLGIAVLLIVVLAVRRKRGTMLRPNSMAHCPHQLDMDPIKTQKMSPMQPSRQNSMLEINTGK